MTPYVLAVAMILAVVVLSAAQKWPGIWVALRFPESDSWPIISATVEQEIVYVMASPGHSVPSFHAEITYSYQVSGEYYSGRYKVGVCNSEAEAEDLIKPYPKGSALQIRVHPRKPELSVL